MESAVMASVGAAASLLPSESMTPYTEPASWALLDLLKMKRKHPSSLHASTNQIIQSGLHIFPESESGYFKSQHTFFFMNN
jgi:hypothetical protein